MMRLIPVLAALQRDRVQLEPILVMHHRTHETLEKLATCAGDPRECGTHEYTLSNLKFARAVEPGNLQLVHYSKRCNELPAQGLPTLPSTIEVERFAPLRQLKNGSR